MKTFTIYKNYFIFKGVKKRLKERERMRHEWWS